MLSSSFEPLRRLFRHISTRRRRQLVLLLLLMLVGAFAELASLGAVLPFLALLADPEMIANYPSLDYLLTAIGWTTPGARLLATTLVFAGGAVLAGLLRVGLGWASSKFVYMLGHDLTIKVYDRIIHQPYRFFVARNSSEIIAAFNKVQFMTGKVLVAMMNLVTATALSAFILFALLLIDAKTALIAAAGFAAIYLFVSHTVRRRLRENSVIAAGAQSARIQNFQEAVGGIRNVLLDHTQELYVRKLETIDVPLRNAEAANNLISVAPRYLVEAGSMVLIAVIAYTLTRQPGAVAAALPTLGALALGAQKLLPLLQQIYLGWVAAASNFAVLNDVLDMAELPVPIEHAERHSATPLTFEKSIELRHVDFGYGEDGPLVLRDINIEIGKGVRCGIVGKSGGGKSTLIDLVMGLLQPTSGHLRVDQVPLAPHNLRAWQARIAHVPQIIYLSDASIAENIALGVDKTRIDVARVRDAARQAQVLEFVNDLPDGFDTLVGERGIRLSGGQRQRIAIARALYKRADVLILDEATSALDDETERAVVECLDSLDADLTVIIIAHRLSTVRKCDLLIRLEAGTIVTSGTYEQVIGVAGTVHRASS